jgi:Icc-related predicted phosphoesterase
MAQVIRLAAVGDLHMRPAAQGRFRPAFARLPEVADLLLLAGDLTNGGTLAEARVLCDEIADLGVPVVAVLGNHDHDEGNGDLIGAMLRELDVHVLDGDTVTVHIAGRRVGVAGVMGGGGGFPDLFPDHFPDHDVPLHVADEERLRQGPRDAERLRSALATLDCDLRIALIHFAPIPDTLAGEPLEIYAGLGCHELGEAIDAGDAHLTIHGHAHSGTEFGSTSAGRPVYNVAYPVLRRPYAVVELDG